MKKEISKHRWRLSDLFTDSKDGSLSTSKLWFTICGVVTTGVFIADAIANNGTSAEKIAAYSGTGGLTAMASKFISTKRGHKNDMDTDC